LYKRDGVVREEREDGIVCDVFLGGRGVGRDVNSSQQRLRRLRSQHTFVWLRKAERRFRAHRNMVGGGVGEE
jgi:hypothetical protein